MMMELDSQSITPPSSPIIGYSGSKDEQTLIASGVLSCLNCKGIPRLNDFSFSPESYILRREVISAVECLRNEYDHVSNTKDRPKLLQCFGYNFDPLDINQVKKMILICRKNISTLEVLSESSHAFTMMQDFDEPEEEPWVLRLNVCQFLNIILKGLKYYRTIWKREQIDEMFSGLKKSLMRVKDWPSVLKTHCGYKHGNENCSSATYHFFHLQIELRWTLFLIFGATPTITGWFLDELIHLASYIYTTKDKEPLNEKQPFNCMCIKEVWTMIRLVIEHMTPEPRKEKPFWTLYTEAMQRLPRSDPFFTIWLTANVAQISDYNIAGAHRPGSGRVDSKENGNNAYQFIQGVFKEWMNRGGKSVEILRLCFSLFEHWGGDIDIITALWTQWVPRLDRGSDVASNFESYSTIDNWLTFISEICESCVDLCLDDSNASRVSSLNSAKGAKSSSNNDPFMDLVALVAAYSKWASERDIRRLKSNLLMKLMRINSNDFAEIGIIRVSTLFMALSTVTEFEREAVSIFERLQDVFAYGKGKNTPGRRRTILRAYSCMIFVLLKKNISLSVYPSLATIYMKIIDELLCQTASEKKELVMVYIDLLNSLPKHSPALSCRQDLGRHLLISSNLSMWLSNAGENYLVRTARSLSQITEKVVKWATDPNVLIDSNFSSEGKEIFSKISEKSLSFIKSNVLMNVNRIPSTDIEPLASMAADIAVLTLKFKRNKEEYHNQFDLFALNERTCPWVSQHFVERLCKSLEFIDNTFSSVKQIQVWIRLVSLDRTVPDVLTELVLKNGFRSTSNEALLGEFCKNGQNYDREEIQRVLSPLVALLNGVMNANLFKEEAGQAEGAHIIDSVISSCAIVLENLRLENLYLRGCGTGVAQQFLNLLAPPSWPSTPPWEKFLPAIMKSLERNLYSVFRSVATFPGMEQDQFLSRKLQDIVVFSFFGFVRDPEKVDKSNHPAFRILDFVEDEKISLIQTKVLPNVIAGEGVLKDSKLCKLFVAAVYMFRVKQVANVVMQVLGSLIRAHIMYQNSTEKQNIVNHSCNSVVYCCLVASTGKPEYKKLALDAFSMAFEKEFLGRSRQVLQLCTSIVKSKNVTNGKLDGRRFIKFEILPLLKIWVEKCEQRRGIGIDNSLRAPLKNLEMELEAVF